MINHKFNRYYYSKKKKIFTKILNYPFLWCWWLRNFTSLFIKKYIRLEVFRIFTKSHTKSNSQGNFKLHFPRLDYIPPFRVQKPLSWIIILRIFSFLLSFRNEFKQFKKISNYPTHFPFLPKSLTKSYTAVPFVANKRNKKPISV